MKIIADLINQHQIPTKMVLGKYDKIIVLENMKMLLEKLEDYELVMLETGHKSLLEEFGSYLQKS